MTWQSPGILYADAELVITTALRAALVARGDTDVFVGRAIPTPRRPRMVIVNRDGGPAENLSDRPRIRVRVWGSTDQAATDLARLVVALASELVGSNGINRCVVESGPYEVADESGQPQRYLLFEFHIKGVAL